jgi:hypothetical protein
LSETPNLDAFTKAMADFAADYLDPAWKSKKVGTELRRPTDATFEAIFRGYIEISESLDSLDLAERLIGLALPRAKGVNKDKYLNFVVAAYLQDIYILEQRMTAYATKLSRMYRLPKLPSFVQEIVYQPLENIIKARGAHVHTRRYVDEHLDAVGTFALFKRVGHDLGQHLDDEYRTAQLHWKKLVKTNRVQFKQIVDRYFKVIKAAILQDGLVKFPPPSAA